jgi:2-polyprenyl-6-methoxyphenol hydroxylase-like FAD-dependent oxidoreductase
MSEIVIVGGGVVGMGLGMMLAHDGHSVTNLERDADPVPQTVDQAWDDWQRTGVNQFRLPHLFLARYREILEKELPEVVAALERDGALRVNPMSSIPAAFTGGHREGDERYEMLSGRRAVVERSVASVAERTPGLTIRRGVAVDGLTAVESIGPPYVTGVRTTEGETVAAELVVDCSGRRSSLPGWFEALGVRRPPEVLDDSGFTYLGRHFRSADGELPVSLGGALQEFGSISVLTLPADNGSWSVTLVTRSGDRALLGLRDIDRWTKVVRSLPSVAHWIDADPIEDRVVTITKIEDRQRDLSVDGVPLMTGIVAVADAWACTNPSGGRGASIGMMHAQGLRDTLREVGVDQPLLVS